MKRKLETPKMTFNKIRKTRRQFFELLQKISDDSNRSPYRGVKLDLHFRDEIPKEFTGADIKAACEKEQ